MTPFHRPRHLAAATLLSVVWFATACGGSADVDPAAGVATVSDSASADVTPDTANSDGGGTGLEAPEDPEEALALFDECMDAAGFSVGASVPVGGSDSGIAVPDGSSQPEEDPQDRNFDIEDSDFDGFEKARAECEPHLANIGFGFDLTPEQEAEFADIQLEFANCMEQSGVVIIDPSQSGSIEVEEESEIDPQTGQASLDDLEFDFEALNQAAAECEQILNQFGERLDAGGE